MNTINNESNLTMRSKHQHGLLILNVKKIHYVFHELKAQGIFTTLRFYKVLQRNYIIQLFTQ